MKEYTTEIKKYFSGKWGYLAVLLLGILICLNLTLSGSLSKAVGFGLLPFVIVVAFELVKHPKVLFFILFAVNYIIMGLLRYVNLGIPTSVLMDGLFMMTIIMLAIHSLKDPEGWSRVMNAMVGIYALWIIFCLIEAFNDTTGTGFAFKPWFQEVRPLAFHIFYIIVIYALLFNKLKDIKWLLFIWGIFILLASAKGYWQRNQGFDRYEMAWLWSVGARTHFISTGIRYFSFFSDAANYGSNMASSMVVFSICALYIKKKREKLYCLLIALAAGYSMFISGTRSAIMVAIIGFVVFTFLAKNWKYFLLAVMLLVTSIVFFKYTTLGDTNRFIHRMRTAFNPTQDASFQVRLNNQKALRTYMREASWGIGIGRNRSNVPVNNKYWLAATTPPDSTLVSIWMKTGIIGLVIFLTVVISMLIGESYIILFKIKHKELRGILTAFTCGAACMLVAGYGNEVYTQYPNSLLFFGTQALVFIGPYFDRKMTEADEQKKLEDQKKVIDTEMEEIKQNEQIA